MKTKKKKIKVEKKKEVKKETQENDIEEFDSGFAYAHSLFRQMKYR